VRKGNPREERELWRQKGNQSSEKEESIFKMNAPSTSTSTSTSASNSSSLNHHHHLLQSNSHQPNPSSTSAASSPQPAAVAAPSSSPSTSKKASPSDIIFGDNPLNSKDVKELASMGLITDSINPQSITSIPHREGQTSVSTSSNSRSTETAVLNPIVIGKPEPMDRDQVKLLPPNFEDAEPEHITELVGESRKGRERIARDQKSQEI